MQKSSINFQQVNEHFLQKKSLIDLFLKTIETYPNKTALIFEEKSMSYYILNNLSDQFANKLQKKGIKKGAIIGVYLNRSFDLFIAIIGILKTGAGYVPFDINTPIDRVRSVLLEMNIAYCISDININEKIESISSNTDFFSATFLATEDLTDTIAYIIFTSGSTGKPKGIPIKHYQIAHLIQSENSVLKIQHTDIVYQGFSVSFDMWMEEVWISFFVGATICIANELTAKTFDQLDLFLNKHKITVLHAVPSLLALINNNIPSLRIVNSGGEACNQHVLNKWAQPNIHFYNSYGPTETTVSATFIELHKNDAITIGFPLPNYSMAVINEQLNPVDIGVQGELVIAGIGLSEGYYKRPDLTEKVFLPKPVSLNNMFGNMIYLTGDWGMMNNDGSFKVTGRKDDQIKIRGYRIELGEIEACINNLPFVQSAVVVSRKINEMDQLLAYVIPFGDEFDEKVYRKKMAEILPPYMIPNQFIQINSFQYLPSGKIDKKLLPVFNPSSQLAIDSKKQITAFKNDSFASEIALIIAALFPNQEIKLSTDFFNDLGGHSLLAANFVSKARELNGLSHISIIDIYQKRTIGNIIEFWKTQIDKNPKINKVDVQKVSLLSYYTCWFFQTIALIFIYGLVGAQIFIPYLGYYIVASEFNNSALSILIAITLFCTVTPLIILFTFLCKHLIIGKFKEGDYPLWGTYYFKWWLYKKILDIIPLETISNTLLYPSFLKRIGMQTANDAQLSKVDFGAPDLISIGKNVTISANVILHNANVENGILKLRKIIIGNNAYIGTGCVINGGCILNDGAELKDLSCIESNTIIPLNECWEGSPAKFSHIKEPIVAPPPISRRKRIKYAAFFLLIVSSFPLLIVLPLIPSIIGLNYLDDNADWYSFTYLISTPVFSLIYLLLFISEVILLSLLFRNNIKVGKYSIYSRIYLKKWFLEQLFSLLLIVIKPIFATVYIKTIYRALGAKVGKNTEISNASNVCHHLLEIGDESFIADVAVIGECDIRNQELILQKTTIGNKSFIGNSAQIPQGYHLGNNKLIGVLSIPPPNNLIEENTPSDWFGSPSLQLPKREIKNKYPDHLTYKPSIFRKITRAIVELIRILIPQSFIFTFSILFIAYTHDLLVDKRIDTILFLFPFYYIGIVAFPLFCITVLLKWMFIGKYQQAEYPMWTWEVWRTEAITSFYETLAVPFLLFYLEGTPFLPMMLRLLGTKIGKKVWLNTTDITEFDMVNIGDNAALNSNSGPQTHLFEDRVMKIGTVSIGSGTNIGAGSIILYDSVIEKNCTIGSLSLVMKGEHLPENTSWHGIPIQKTNKIIDYD